MGGRVRRDAADAYAYGCNAFLEFTAYKGIEMNVSALAKASWNSHGI